MAKAAIIILGMHRSGTSCLTGSLEQAGLYLGAVNRKAPHNAKGNNENRAIMDLNDAVLSENCAAWDHPPKKPIQWSRELKNRRDRLLTEYPENMTIGFKDPRTLFTLEGWLEALPEARLAGTFRHPLAVAQSLNTRNGFPLRQGLELWLSYNYKLLSINKNNEMPLLCFDWPTSRYSAGLETICERMNLTPPTQGFDFFEATLRQNRAPQTPPDEPDIRDVYEDLLSLSGKLCQN